MADKIELKPCPFCGAEVTMQKGRTSGGYAFCHPQVDWVKNPTKRCVVRANIVFVNYREASEWAAAWNRRADNG